MTKELKSHSIEKLFDGDPADWNAGVDRPRWAAMGERWRGFGIADDDLRMMCWDLVSLRVDREKYEETLLDRAGLVRVPHPDGVDRSEKRRAPTDEEKRERKAYETALRYQSKRLDRIRVEGRKEPADLVRAAKALKTLTLPLMSPPKMPPGHQGAVWARPRVQRVARVLIRRGLSA